ncbi:MAG: ABC transporter permease [Acidobacteriaceae bacterium]|nr:ABC transporter permease [Acidobacteriaceae bacterium]
MLQALTQDIRFAFRQFRKRPGFTALTILILALGLGANTAIFSIVNAFLLRSLPFKEPDRLVALFERNVVNYDEQRNWVAPANFLDWQKLSTSFEQIAAYVTGNSNLSSSTNTFEPERIDFCACSGNLFSTLGVPPLLGRDFRSDEDRYGAPRVVAISYGLWQRRFGAAPNVIGKRVRIDSEDYQIVAVMPRGFAFPSRTIEAWSPLLTFLPPERQKRHDTHFLQPIARLKPGVSVEKARAEIDGIAARYKRTHPQDVSGRGGNVLPLHDSLVWDVRTSLLLLLGAVGCVLLIACVNVANLLLTRATGRIREVSIRAAVGASQNRIISQLLTESILLALAGGVVGVFLAISITEILISHAPGADAILPAGRLPLDPMVFLFVFCVSLLTGIAAGLYPAIQSSRTDLTNSLKDSSRSATPTRSHGRFRSILVTAEVALSMVLLVAAGLLLRSFSHLYRVNPGVRIDHTLTMAVSLPDASYQKPPKTAAFLTQLTDRIQTIPGIKSAGLTTCAPVSGHCDDLVFHIEGEELPAGQMRDALDRAADPGYFAAVGLPLIRGRLFSPQDGIGFDEKHPKMGAVVISASTAKTYFAHEDPIGRHIFFGIDLARQQLTGTPVPRYEVVGIVGDTVTDLDQKIRPTVYLPILDGRWSEFYVVLHTAFEPHSAISAARKAIDQLNPDLAVYDVHTMDELIGQSASDRQFSMLLFGSFAGLAVLLAAVGLYGVLSYAVSQRRGEIGIRMALGASNSDVSRLVLKQGMTPALAGIVIGILVALFASQLLRTLLFGISPVDPLTFVLVPPLLLGIAGLACYIPAVRAARIDPTLALRTE